MTVDELVLLTEALLTEAGVEGPSTFRSGQELLTGLDDDTFLLAVRFVAGERAEVGAGPAPAARPKRQLRELTPEEVAERDRMLALVEHEDEVPPRPQRVYGDAPAKAVDIGDGVVVGFE